MSNSKSFGFKGLSDLAKEVNGMNVKSTLKVESRFADYVRSLDWDNIGPLVFTGDINANILLDISAVCRRAFKKNDVIVYVGIENDEDYEEGIVFTETSIFYWRENGRYVKEMNYSDIAHVDYDDESVIIEMADDLSTEISLGADAESEKYPRYMYSFIMDILDYEEDDESEEEDDETDEEEDEE